MLAALIRQAANVIAPVPGTLQTRRPR